MSNVSPEPGSRIVGTLRDNAGMPVPNEVVKFTYQDPLLIENDVWIYSTRTDAQGRFVLCGLRPNAEVHYWQSDQTIRAPTVGNTGVVTIRGAEVIQ